mgnify:CR=1 FL=1
MKAYEHSLKYYRDMKNVIDTANEDGFDKGKEEGRTVRGKDGNSSPNGKTRYESRGYLSNNRSFFA